MRMDFGDVTLIVFHVFFDDELSCFMAIGILWDVN